MKQRGALGIWLGLLLPGCGHDASPVAADASVDVAAATLVPDSPQAPSAAVTFAQSPECLEVVVSTVCGETVRCSKTGEDRLVFRDGKPLSGSQDPCLGELAAMRRELLAIAKAPFQRGFPPSDPFARARAGRCPRPEMVESQRAYADVLARVKREGLSRVAGWERGTRAYWSTLIRERFDFTEVAVSCRGAERGAFFLKVQSDVGAPGSIPYGGVWRVARGGGLVSLAEVSDGSPVVTWSAGDLDGDGAEELIARVPLSERGEARGARYELLDVAHEKNLVLLLRSEEKPEDAGQGPAVYGVPLGASRGLVVGERLVVYGNHAVTDAGESAREGLRAAEARARGEVEAIVGRLDAAIPACGGAAVGPARAGCEDGERVGWTLALGRELVRVGVSDGAGAVARAAALSGLSGCLEGTEVVISR